jgi:hypothetical protein
MLKEGKGASGAAVILTASRAKARAITIINEGHYACAIDIVAAPDKCEGICPKWASKQLIYIFCCHAPLTAEHPGLVRAP